VAGQNVGLDAAINYEAEMFALCFADADQREGMNAFAEKRTPAFAGHQAPE
jgi:enoyl-CoA hydratase